MSATRSSPTQARVNPYPEVTVLSYKMHKVLVKLPGAVAPVALYQYIQAEAFKRFRGIACDPSEVTLWTLDWPGFGGEEVEVTEEAFPNLERLRRLVVKGPTEDECVSPI
ncbi:hypothetical protein D9611_012291 [Ephemerocybe angulata]|uniref:Uncharacterized protein n=1 Tax=Ephemerocybe angulata TaxID=980116 RepID=A0A8H5AT90_9AGAR|nr:hypothetical protein D9611_012291 [Tulosesus angulatus]